MSSLYQATDTDSFDNWYIKYLGRNGQLTAFLRSIQALPTADRATVGRQANATKKLLSEEFITAKNRLKTLEHPQAIDVTLPGRKPPIGRYHPITSTIRSIMQIFNNMGFQTLTGPEIEEERYNFDMLNIPKYHPARDQWNTIWLELPTYNNMLLRTHTSPMQVRILEQQQPPLRVVVPGKCYRHEATDSTHEWQFHQIEGIAVSDDISFTHLKGTLFEFAKRFFGTSKIRFRCDFFPFVEPGVDMSIECFSCSGSGCRLCAMSGWIEVLGAGMVHPNVLQGLGYSKELTGFAFGMGVERIAMLKYNISDIREFFINDLRFLCQFHM